MRGCKGDRFWEDGGALVGNSFFWWRDNGAAIDDGKGRLTGERMVRRMILRP
jgi:hypothetical protein